MTKLHVREAVSTVAQALVKLNVCSFTNPPAETGWLFG